VILADTSAWVEFLRKTASTAHRAFREALLADEVATTDAVVLEVLAGARTDHEEEQLARLLARCRQVPQEPWGDPESAAEVYRACRRGGETPRSLFDCLVAAVAIRHDLPVLYRDRDFDVIARHTPLRLAV
jgi:predicted nucleic acid-binding protein